MKKFIQLSMLIMALAFVFVTPVLAQATDPADPDPIDTYFYSLASVAALALVLTSVITKSIQMGSTIKQYISWIVSIALAFVGYYFEVGMFEGINVVWTIILGLAAGLLSNGLYDAALIQAILEFLKLKVPTTRK